MWPDIAAQYAASEEAHMGIIWWILVGLVAGLLARLLVPGRNRMGIGATILLGLVGSLIGGFLGQLVDNSDRSFSDFTPAGLIGSIIGAIVALLIYNAMGRRRRRVM